MECRQPTMVVPLPATTAMRLLRRTRTRQPVRVMVRVLGLAVAPPTRARLTLARTVVRLLLVVLLLALTEPGTEERRSSSLVLATAMRIVLLAAVASTRASVLDLSSPKR
jgi:type II secretory pathway component PulM